MPPGALRTTVPPLDQPGEATERSLTGLLTDLPRKHCDTTAAAVADTSTERLRPLLTAATWEPHALDQQRVTAWVAQSPTHGVLVLDATGVPKQGAARSGSPVRMRGRWARAR